MEVDFTGCPPKGIPDVPGGNDLVQVIDYVEEKDALAYAGHATHISLVTDMGEYLDKVTAIGI